MCSSCILPIGTPSGIGVVRRSVFPSLEYLCLEFVIVDFIASYVVLFIMVLCC